jgi:hypothetical protein
MIELRLKMKIAITAHLDETTFWHAGAPQHSYLVYQLLKSLGYEVIVVTKDLNTENFPKNLNYKQIGEMSRGESSEFWGSFDAIIAFAFLPEFAVRSDIFNSTKIILQSTYNEYCGDVQTMMYGEGAQGDYDINRGYIHEVWTNAQFESTKDYLKAIFNTEKAFIVPYLYERDFIKKKLGGEVEINVSGGLGVAICEMNRTYSKNSLFPFATCARANKLNAKSRMIAPLIKHANLFCVKGTKLGKSHPFKTYHEYLKETHSLKSKIDKRKPLNEIFEKENNCLMSCATDDWGLNRLYFDAIHLGVPLVHNSRFIKDIGYYYNDLNMEEAIKGLKKARNEFNQAEYREKGAEVLFRYSIKNPIVKELWIRRMECSV